MRPLPDWETLPYDTLSPHQDLVSERLETLYRLSQPDAGDIDVLVVPATTALHRLAPPQYVAGHTFFFRQGQKVDGEALRAQLVFAGYQHVSQVVAPGEFAIRGGLIDLFPMGSALPYRLDLLDDQLETIRAFDPDTQRSLYPVRTSGCCPAASSRSTRPRARRSGAAGATASKATRAARASTRTSATASPSQGIEYYLPLFFDDTATLFDYLPGSAIVVMHGADRGGDPAFLERNQRAPPLPRARHRPARSCRRPSSS